MRVHSSIAAAALIASSSVAQSNTLPKGWDTKEGIEVGTTTASQFWAGFDLGTASTATYNPAKAMFVYDASLFPWNAANGTVITKIAFRRDGESNAYTAHKRQWVVTMSTNNRAAGQADMNHYGRNHGGNKTIVFGAIGKPKDVSFGATAAPTAGKTAPFDVSITLDKVFVVPKGAKSLIVEIRSYSVSGATSGRWRCDAVTYPGTGYAASSFGLVNTNHCVSPSILYHSRVNNIGSTVGHVYRTYKAPGGRPFFGIVGTQNTTPFKFPGTTCDVHVNLFAMVVGTTNKSGQYAAYFDFGQLPQSSAFIGAKAWFQGLIADPTYPGGAGLTRAWHTTIGKGYDPSVTKATQIYSYGANTIEYTGTASGLVVNPDLETHGRYFYRRVPVIKVN